jgi:hypothetical protein
MEFLPHDKLKDLGRIPRCDEHQTVHIRELKSRVVRIMVSHRWLQDHVLPDGKSNEKHALLCGFVQTLCRAGWVKSDDVCDVAHWIDYGKFVLCMTCQAQAPCVCVCVCVCVYIYIYITHT